MSWKKGQAPWETGNVGQSLAGMGFKKGQAPWEQQQGDGTLTPREPLNMDEAVLDERHPAIDWKDRAIIKNFSNSPEAGVQYLQKKYPQLDVGSDAGGIAIKGPGDEYARRLDPSTMELEDISDVGADIGMGAAQTAGAAAGAGGGLLVGGPGFMVPGAMVGSAGASGGAEYLRQKIGQYLGLPQKIDQSQVGVSTVMGGLTTGAMGAQPMKDSSSKVSVEPLDKSMTTSLVRWHHRLVRGRQVFLRVRFAPWGNITMRLRISIKMV